MREYMPSRLRFEVFQRDGFRCTYCGRSAKDGAELHADHIVSVRDGGPTTLANLTTACSDCNSGKGRMSLPALSTTAWGEYCHSRLWVCAVGLRLRMADYGATIRYFRQSPGPPLPPRRRDDANLWFALLADRETHERLDRILAEQIGDSIRRGRA